MDHSILLTQKHAIEKTSFCSSLGLIFNYVYHSTISIKKAKFKQTLTVPRISLPVPWIRVLLNITVILLFFNPSLYGQNYPDMEVKITLASIQVLDVENDGIGEPDTDSPDFITLESNTEEIKWPKGELRVKEGSTIFPNYQIGLTTFNGLIWDNTLINNKEIHFDLNLSKYDEDKIIGRIHFLVSNKFGYILIKNIPFDNYGWSHDGQEYVFIEEVDTPEFKIEYATFTYNLGFEQRDKDDGEVTQNSKYVLKFKFEAIVLKK